MIGSRPELVKLYYRIGEVSQIVGVQPHVLRYWESEFRTIKPQKSSKGQRVYSRRDVEKLLRVKDLLRDQGFTIAGARKRLKEIPAADAVGVAEVTPHEELALATAAELAESAESAEPAEPAADVDSVRRYKTALSTVRADILRMLDELDELDG